MTSSRSKRLSVRCFLPKNVLKKTASKLSFVFYWTEIPNGMWCKNASIVTRPWIKHSIGDGWGNIQPCSLPSTSLVLIFYANIHLTARTMSPWHRNRHQIHQQSNRETKQRFILILLQHSGVERLSQSHLHTHTIKKEERGNPLFQRREKITGHWQWAHQSPNYASMMSRFY